MRKCCLSLWGRTPDEDSSADLKYVLSVARDCGRYMNDYLLIVTSTVPVGNCPPRARSGAAAGARPTWRIGSFDVASNPEFPKGAAIEDFLKPDRIVIGLETERSKQLMNQLTSPSP